MLFMRSMFLLLFLLRYQVNNPKLPLATTNDHELLKVRDVPSRSFPFFFLSLFCNFSPTFPLFLPFCSGSLAIFLSYSSSLSLLSLSFFLFFRLLNMPKKNKKTKEAARPNDYWADGPHPRGGRNESLLESLEEDLGLAQVFQETTEDDEAPFATAPPS